MLAIEQRVQFRSKSIVAYNLFHPVRDGIENKTSAEILNFRMSAKFKANAEKLREREKYTGQITAGAKKRLTKAISLLVQSSPEKWIYNQVTKKNQHHKISFITLTLPDIEKAKDAKFTHKHLLQPMLRILRNKYKMNSYVWKAELQKNDSVHYHITTDLFMPWEQLRQHWNAILAKNGFLEAFQKKYGHDNPNSVDIHSVNKINDLEAYLVKYISKEYQNKVKLAGKVWDCSKNLKEAKYFSTELSAELHEQILKEIDLGWLQPIYRDRCTILRSRTTDYYQSFSQPLIDQYYSHLTAIRQWESNKPQRTNKSTGTSSSESVSFERPATVSALAVKKQSSKTFRQLSMPLSVGMYVPLRN